MGHVLPRAIQRRVPCGEGKTHVEALLRSQHRLAAVALSSGKQAGMAWHGMMGKQDARKKAPGMVWLRDKEGKASCEVRDFGRRDGAGRWRSSRGVVQSFGGASGREGKIIEKWMRVPFRKSLGLGTGLACSWTTVTTGGWVLGVRVRGGGWWAAAGIEGRGGGLWSGEPRENKNCTALLGHGHAGRAGQIQ